MTSNQKFKSTEVEVQSIQEVNMVLKKANTNRKVGQTAINA